MGSLIRYSKRVERNLFSVTKKTHRFHFRMLKTAVMCLILMRMGSAQGNGLEQSDDYYQENSYESLYGLGKAFASSTWSSSYKAKKAFKFSYDNHERRWCSDKKSLPAAIWFQFEQPKRVIKIKFEEHYKLPAGSLYEVFASNKYGKCGDETFNILARFEASAFAWGRELLNPKSYYCYGVRAYAYDTVHNVVSLKRIQLRIEAPPNQEISSKLEKFINTVELLQSHLITQGANTNSRLTKLETAGHITCQMGYEGFANEETEKTGSIVKEISLKGFKETPMMAVALKDITVTGPNSGLQINGLAHSATYASLQLFTLTDDKPRGVAITWIACGK